MKKLLTIMLVSLTVFLLTGCESKKENNESQNQGNNNQSSQTQLQKDVCPNCVFAIYKDKKKYGTNGEILKNYTKDYTELKDENGNQQTVFLGHILDNNGKIERGFVCGVEKEKLFCIEALNDGSKYESNNQILLSIFDNENCGQFKANNEIGNGFTCDSDDNWVFNMEPSENLKYVFVEAESKNYYCYVDGKDSIMVCE